MACALKLAPRIKELRVHLCQKGQSSKGIREFIESYYVNLKKSNPDIPILVRECSGVQPVLWARFDKGRETCVSLSDIGAKDILAQIQSLSK